jgi:DNA repair protein RAD50
MSFFTPTNQYMVVDRNIQLLVKKTVRSQKTLEGSLSIRNENGETISVSSRVAELDQLMPQYLGVSKAILESVIFCHQDESLWPMSTPSLLKKRFDEIFEAHKYTKAIDNLKMIRKRKMDDLAQQKLIESHAKLDKEKGARTERRSQEVFEEIEALRKQHDDLGHKIKIAVERSREAWDLSAKFEKILAELHGKQIRAQTLEQSMNSISMNLVAMEESDEELKNMLERYDEHLAGLAREKDAFSARWSEMNGRIEKARQDIGQKQTALGGHKNAMQQFERQMEARKALIAETAARHNIRGFEMELDEDQVQEFMSRLARLAREQSSNWERFREEVNDERSRAEKLLSSLKEQRLVLSKGKETARSQIETNDASMARIQAQINGIEADEGSKAVLEERVKEVDQSLKDAKDSLRDKNLDLRIEEVETTLTTLLDKKDRLDKEQAEAVRNSTDLVELDILSKKLKERQKLLDTNSASYDAEIRRVLESDWTPENLDSKFRAVLAEKDDALKRAQSQRDGVQRENEHHQFRLTETAERLSTRRKELAENARIVLDATGDDPSEFAETLEQLETSYGIMKDDRTSFGNMKDYYQKCLAFANSNSACRLCERKLKDNEKARFTQRLEKQVNDAVQKLADENERLVEAEIAKYRQIRANYEAWLHAKDSIPAEEMALSAMETQRESLTRRLEECDVEVQERADAKRDVEAVAKWVQTIMNNSQEIVKFQAEIKGLEQKTVALGSVRSPEAIRADITTANSEIREQNGVLNKARSEREQMLRKVNHLELEVRDLRTKLSETSAQLREISSLESQLADLKKQNRQLRDSVKDSEDRIQSLLPKIEQAEVKVTDIEDRGKVREREMQASLEHTKDSINRLQIAQKDITDYITDGGPQKLARETREMEELEQELRGLEADLVKIGRECNRIDAELRDEDIRKRTIVDNISYRSSIKELEAVKREIVDLETSNASGDKARHDKEGEKWQTERNKLSAEQAGIMGQLKSKDDQLQSMLDEWQNDYKDAANKYKEAHVRVEVTKATVEDLSRYAAALDKAIMKFHSIKMEEINHTMQDLWKKTYRGTDVDSIMIRSENENQKGNKVYNYRVVMVKQNVEMDMRGRCSAGQKVLASIIIRLALAECFSTNCGLIALDEPTTNLDRDNIRSLAQSLHDLIIARRRQKNFQLIIITHDEEFLRHMNSADLCDEYFKVKRDGHQNSTLWKQKISEIYT